MARTARVLENKGYLHVITRGNAQQIIFEDDQDYGYYLKLIREYASENNITICAYCLMTNHVHLLIHYEDKNVATFMHKVGISYSNYFNKKYDRTGHVFQGRYKSEIIDNEQYFLTVNRYILQNPVKAGLSKNVDYKWNSYDISAIQNSFVNTSLLIDILGGYDNYVRFMMEENDDVCMEGYSVIRNDEWAEEVMMEILGTKNGNYLVYCDKSKRDEAIRMLKNKGLSVRQISRLTGLGKGIVQKA